MRVATWNVNSIRARSERVAEWLIREDVDVLAMQEIKCRESQFPYEDFANAGYEVALHGLNQWNGVAFASRLPMDDVTAGFPSSPGWGKHDGAGVLPQEARALAVTVEGVRLWSLYVPNGRTLEDPHYLYKLEWLERLAEDAASWLEHEPDVPLALMGDWNIAPRDTDVWDIGAFAGSTHVSPAERAAFERFATLGITDVVRDRVPTGYTYWDYKQLRFPRNEGMRIDFILGSPAFSSLVTSARIYRDERKGKAPSDHVPVLVQLDKQTSDAEDRPMIFG